MSVKQGGVWVKASERLPKESNDNLVCRWNKTGIKFINEFSLAGWFKQIADSDLGYLEWLDESEPHPVSKEPLSAEEDKWKISLLVVDLVRAIV